MGHWLTKHSRRRTMEEYKPQQTSLQQNQTMYELKRFKQSCQDKLPGDGDIDSSTGTMGHQWRSAVLVGQFYTPLYFWMFKCSAITLLNYVYNLWFWSSLVQQCSTYFHNTSYVKTKSSQDFMHSFDPHRKVSHVWTGIWTGDRLLPPSSFLFLWGNSANHCTTELPPTKCNKSQLTTEVLWLEIDFFETQLIN